MVFKVTLKNHVAGKGEIEVDTLNWVDGCLVKGKYQTPRENIIFIEDMS